MGFKKIEPTRGFQEMIPEFTSSFCMENLEKSVTNLWSSRSVTRYVKSEICKPRSEIEA